MIQGIVDGIIAKLAEVKAAAKRVADAVKDVLGFSVPKEGQLHSYTELMPHFMQGIADGIEHNKYRVLNAMRDLASQIQLGVPSRPYPQTAGTVGVGGISQTINIYSPKALSPSETARKAKIAAQELALEWGV